MNFPGNIIVYINTGSACIYTGQAAGLGSVHDDGFIALDGRQHPDFAAPDEGFDDGNEFDGI